TTACLIQERLGLGTNVAAFDYNLGCSAFPYGLAIVRGLIDAGIASTALLLMADTYSKFIHPLDKSVRTLFGDAASAVLITAEERAAPSIGPFVLGTDGTGAGNLIVPAGAMRHPLATADLAEKTDKSVIDAGRVARGDVLLVAGFGVGYSWGANLIRWEPNA